MNPQTANAVTDSNSAPLHCQYRTASGRRCRLPAVAGMAVSDPRSGLCHKHAAERQQNLDQADLAAALIGDIMVIPDLPRPDCEEYPASDTSPDSRRGSESSGPSPQAPAADDRQPICRT